MKPKHRILRPNNVKRRMQKRRLFFNHLYTYLLSYEEYDDRAFKRLLREMRRIVS